MDDLHPTISQVADFLEQWAPISSAQSYDNVGLQIGDPASRVERALIALDMTPDLLREAAAVGASLIITHHPLIFKPLREITPRALVTNLALRLAESRIALYSIHTNLDAASGGVSFALGERLGLRDLRFLDAIDIDGREIGLGALGSLEQPLSLQAFLVHVSERLSVQALRYVGDREASVSRVAVCGGAGAEYVERAMAAGADVYLTSDVKYHRFFDVLDNDGRPVMALIDAGHHETEAMTVDLLLTHLTDRFPSIEWLAARTHTNPVRTFVSSISGIQN